MPRTKYSLSEPLTYEDELDLVDKHELIAHTIHLEEQLVASDEAIDGLNEQIDRLQDDITFLQEELNKPQETRPTPDEWKELTRRAAALELDNRTLRSQLAHGNRGPTALDAEDQQQIEAFLRLLEDSGTTYYPKAISRGFASAVRRALGLTEEEEG